MKRPNFSDTVSMLFYIFIRFVSSDNIWYNKKMNDISLLTRSFPILFCIWDEGCSKIGPRFKRMSRVFNLTEPLKYCYTKRVLHSVDWCEINANNYNNMILLLMLSTQQLLIGNLHNGRVYAVWCLYCR